jgi:hypothetical protein
MRRLSNVTQLLVQNRELNFITIRQRILNMRIYRHDLPFMRPLWVFCKYGVEHITHHEIWGSHGDGDVCVGVPVCNAVRTCKHTPKFRRNILSPSSKIMHIFQMCFLRVCILLGVHVLFTQKVIYYRIWKSVVSRLTTINIFWRWRQYVSPKRRYLLTSPHGITTQNTNIDILHFVHTKDLTRVRRGRGVTLTTHPHLVSRLSMSRSYTSSLPMCHHGMQPDSFTFCVQKISKGSVENEKFTAA